MIYLLSRRVVPPRPLGSRPSDGVQPTGRLESTAIDHRHVWLEKQTVYWEDVEQLKGEVIG